MRLLSFLSDIERAINAESPAVEGGAWESTRMVNFEKGLGRLALTPKSPTDFPFPPGVIFLQAFTLADGSQCLKATLSWKGSDVTSAIAVYSTPTLNWNLEASRIGAAWLEGPPANATVATVEPPEAGITPLSAAG